MTIKEWRNSLKWLFAFHVRLVYTVWDWIHMRWDQTKHRKTQKTRSWIEKLRNIRSWLRKIRSRFILIKTAAKAHLLKNWNFLVFLSLPIFTVSDLTLNKFHFIYKETSRIIFFNWHVKNSQRFEHKAVCKPKRYLFKSVIMPVAITFSVFSVFPAS